MQPQNDITIRPVQPNMQECRRVIELIQGQAVHHTLQPSDVKAKPEHLMTELTHDHGTKILGAFAENQMIGYALFYPTVSARGTGVYLEDIYVCPNWRQIKGVGGKLFGHMCAAANGGQAEWEVASNNAIAMQFYHNHCQAQQAEGTDIYDMNTQLISAGVTSESPTGHFRNNLRVRRAVASDFAKLQVSGMLREALLPYLPGIIEHPNGMVLHVCENEQGYLQGVALGSRTYSTFAGKPGMNITFARAGTQEVARRLMKTTLDYAETRGEATRLYCYASDPATRLTCQTLGGKIACFDGPGSELVPFFVTPDRAHALSTAVHTTSTSNVYPGAIDAARQPLRA